MKKNWLLLLLAGIVLFIFILGTSYAWYQVFNEQVEIVANFEIKMEDEGQGAFVDGSIPIDDNKGVLLDPYYFEITNNGKTPGNYKLIIEEPPFNELNDGCTVDTLLERDQIRYQLILNGKEVSLDDLSNVKSSILDYRTIEAGAKNTYELRVWVKDIDTGKSWENKHYNYSIEVVPGNIEEES